MWKAAFGMRSDRSEVGSLASSRKKKSKRTEPSSKETQSSSSRKEEKERKARLEDKRTRSGKSEKSIDTTSSRVQSLSKSSRAESTRSALQQSSNSFYDDDAYQAEREERRRERNQKDEGHLLQGRQDDRMQNPERTSRQSQDEKPRKRTRSASPVSAGLDSPRRSSPRARLARAATLPAEILPEIALTQSPPRMSGALPASRPQVEHAMSLPIQPSRSESYGAAADYYMDEGQSVQHQPGVRASTPNMAVNHDTHLLMASAEPHPAMDTGNGAAAEFYNGRISPVRLSSRPQENTTSGQAQTNSSMLGLSSTIAASSAIAGYASTIGNEGFSSTGPTIQSSATHNQSEPTIMASNSTSPPKPFQNSAHQGVQSNFASHGEGTQDLEPDDHPHYHDPSHKRGPVSQLKEGFLNLLSSPEDVRRMEEYSEYIGICRYCFDPRSSAANAPRPHNYNQPHPTRYDSRRRISRRNSGSSSGSSRRNSDRRVRKDVRVGFNARDRSRSSRANIKNIALAAGAASAAGVSFATMPTRGDFQRPGNTRARSTRSSDRVASPAFVRNNEQSYEDEGFYRRNAQVTKGRENCNTTRNERGEYVATHGSYSRDRRRPSHSIDNGRTVLQYHRGNRPRSRSSGAGSVGLSDYPPGVRSSVRRRSSSSSSQSSGRNVGFFSSIFSPRSSKSSEKHGRRKPEGKKHSTTLFSFANKSSSSVDTSLAFGPRYEGKRDFTARRKATKKRSDEHIAKTVAALSTTAAALALAQNRRKPEQRAGRRANTMASSSTNRRGNDYVQDLPIANDEDEWIDELPSDEQSWSSEADLALAFGDSKLSRQSSFESNSSRSSRDGLTAWDWRWRNRSSKSRPDVVGRLEQDDSLPYAQSSKIDPSSFADPRSHTNSLAHMDPRPIADDDDIATHRNSNTPPLLAQPQPKPTFQPTFVKAGSSNQQLPQKTTDQVKAWDTNVEHTHASPAPVFGGSDMTNSFPANQPNTPAMRDKRLRYETQDDLERRQNGIKNDSDPSKRSEREIGQGANYSSRRNVDDTRQSATPSSVRDSNPGLPKYEVEQAAGRTDSKMPSISVNVGPENKGKPADTATKTTQPPTYSSQHVTPDESSSGAPILDDDLFDRDFFKRSAGQSIAVREKKEAENAQKAADKVVAEIDAYYQQPSPTQADFFAPKDILSSAGPAKTHASESDVDFAPKGRDGMKSRYEVLDVASGKSEYAPYGVPTLQVISPTPPPSLAGMVSDFVSRPRSPSSENEDASSAPTNNDTKKSSNRRSITWGEDETHVYDPHTPEQNDERDAYITGHFSPQAGRDEALKALSYTETAKSHAVTEDEREHDDALISSVGTKSFSEPDNSTDLNDTNLPGRDSSDLNRFAIERDEASGSSTQNKTSGTNSQGYLAYQISGPVTSPAVNPIPEDSLETHPTETKGATRVIKPPPSVEPMVLSGKKAVPEDFDQEDRVTRVGSENDSSDRVENDEATIWNSSQKKKNKKRRDAKGSRYSFDSTTGNADQDPSTYPPSTRPEQDTPNDPLGEKEGDQLERIVDQPISDRQSSSIASKRNVEASAYDAGANKPSAIPSPIELEQKPQKKTPAQQAVASDEFVNSFILARPNKLNGRADRPDPVGQSLDDETDPFARLPQGSRQENIPDMPVKDETRNVSSSKTGGTKRKDEPEQKMDMPHGKSEPYPSEGHGELAGNTQVGEPHVEGVPRKKEQQSYKNEIQRRDSPDGSENLPVVSSDPVAEGQLASEMKAEESFFEVPLSKKDQKKRAKRVKESSAKGLQDQRGSHLSIDGDTHQNFTAEDRPLELTPSLPLQLARSEELPSQELEPEQDLTVSSSTIPGTVPGPNDETKTTTNDDNAPKGEALVQDHSADSAPMRKDLRPGIDSEIEPVYDSRPLSKKEQKKRTKGSKITPLDFKKSDQNESSQDQNAESTQTDDSPWEPPLSKKELKKRAKGQSVELTNKDQSAVTGDAFEEQAQESSRAEESVWEPPLSKKEQKRRSKLTSKQVPEQTLPSDVSSSNQEQRVEMAPSDDSPWEPPLSKKEQKKRAKELKNRASKESEGTPSIPIDEADSSVEGRTSVLQPDLVLSQKEQKHREESASRVGTDEPQSSYDLVQSSEGQGGQIEQDESLWEPPLSKKEQKKRAKARKQFLMDDTPNLDTAKEQVNNAQQSPQVEPANERDAASTAESPSEAIPSNLENSDDVFREADTESGSTRAAGFVDVARSVMSRDGLAALASGVVSSAVSQKDNGDKEPSRMPGSWDDNTEEPIDPFQFQVKDDVELTPSAVGQKAYSGPSPNNNGDVNEPLGNNKDVSQDVPSPSSAWTFEDYIANEAQNGFDPSLNEVKDQQDESDDSYESVRKPKSMNKVGDSRDMAGTQSRSKRARGTSINSAKKDKKGGFFGLLRRSSTESFRSSKRDERSDLSTHHRRSSKKEDTSAFKRAQSEGRARGIDERRKEEMDSASEAEQTGTRDKERRHHRRRRTDGDVLLDDQDQSFLGFRVEGLPPLPIRRSSSPISAHLNKEQDLGKPVSAENQSFSAFRHTRSTDNQNETMPHLDDSTIAQHLEVEPEQPISFPNVTAEIASTNPVESVDIFDSTSLRNEKPRGSPAVRNLPALLELVNVEDFELEDLPPLPASPASRASDDAHNSELENLPPLPASPASQASDDNDNSELENLPPLPKSPLLSTSGVETPRLNELPSLPEAPGPSASDDAESFQFDDLPPLPDSPVHSPTSWFKTPQRAMLPIRPVASTSIPIRFPFGQSRPSPRDRAMSTSTSTPSSPATPSATRKGRPYSFEMRPLYLVEVTRKVAEMEEVLPSLPSSKPSSRSSSAHQANDDVLDARSDNGFRFQQDAVDESHDLVKATSGQTTPRAEDSTRHQPQFYTWEDLRKDEWLHEQAQSISRTNQRVGEANWPRFYNDEAGFVEDEIDLESSRFEQSAPEAPAIADPDFVLGHDNTEGRDDSPHVKSQDLPFVTADTPFEVVDTINKDDSSNTNMSVRSDQQLESQQDGPSAPHEEEHDNLRDGSTSIVKEKGKKNNKSRKSKIQEERASGMETGVQTETADLLESQSDDNPSFSDISYMRQTTAAVAASTPLVVVAGMLLDHRSESNEVGREDKEVDGGLVDDKDFNDLRQPHTVAGSSPISEHGSIGQIPNPVSDLEATQDETKVVEASPEKSVVADDASTSAQVTSASRKHSKKAKRKLKEKMRGVQGTAYQLNDDTSSTGQNTDADIAIISDSVDHHTPEQAHGKTRERSTMVHDIVDGADAKLEGSHEAINTSVTISTHTAQEEVASSLKGQDLSVIKPATASEESEDATTALSEQPSNAKFPFIAPDESPDVEYANSMHEPLTDLPIIGSTDNEVDMKQVMEAHSENDDVNSAFVMREIVDNEHDEAQETDDGYARPDAIPIDTNSENLKRDESENTIKLHIPTDVAVNDHSDSKRDSKLAHESDWASRQRNDDTAHPKHLLRDSPGAAHSRDSGATAHGGGDIADQGDSTAISAKTGELPFDRAIGHDKPLEAEVQNSSAANEIIFVSANSDASANKSITIRADDPVPAVSIPRPVIDDSARLSATGFSRNEPDDMADASPLVDHDQLDETDHEPAISTHISEDVSGDNPSPGPVIGGLTPSTHETEPLEPTSDVKTPLVVQDTTLSIHSGHANPIIDDSPSERKDVVEDLHTVTVNPEITFPEADPAGNTTREVDTGRSTPFQATATNTVAEQTMEPEPTQTDATPASTIRSGSLSVQTDTAEADIMEAEKFESSHPGADRHEDLHLEVGLLATAASLATGHSKSKKAGKSKKGKAKSLNDSENDSISLSAKATPQQTSTPRSLDAQDIEGDSEIATTLTSAFGTASNHGIVEDNGNEDPSSGINTPMKKKKLSKKEQRKLKKGQALAEPSITDKDSPNAVNSFPKETADHVLFSSNKDINQDSTTLKEAAEPDKASTPDAQRASDLVFATTIATGLAEAGFDPEIASSIMDLTSTSILEESQKLHDTKIFGQEGEKAVRDNFEIPATFVTESGARSYALVSPQAGSALDSQESAHEYDDLIRGTVEASGFDPAHFDKIMQISPSKEPYGPDIDLVHNKVPSMATSTASFKDVINESARDDEMLIDEEQSQDVEMGGLKISQSPPHDDSVSGSANRSMQTLEEEYRVTKKKARKDKKKKRKEAVQDIDAGVVGELGLSIASRPSDKSTIDVSLEPVLVAATKDEIVQPNAPTVSQSVMRETTDEPDAPRHLSSPGKGTLFVRSVSDDVQQAHSVLSEDVVRETSQDDMSDVVMPQARGDKQAGTLDHPATETLPHDQTGSMTSQASMSITDHQKSALGSMSEKSVRDQTGDTASHDSESLEDLIVHKTRRRSMDEQITTDRSRTPSGSSTKTSLEPTSKNRVSQLFQSPPGHEAGVIITAESLIVTPFDAGLATPSQRNSQRTSDRQEDTIQIGYRGDSILPDIDEIPHEQQTPTRRRHALPDRDVIEAESARQSPDLLHQTSHQSLRRSSRNISSDLRAASRNSNRLASSERAASRGRLSPQTTIPFEPPPTPPHEHEDTPLYGALPVLGAATMANVFAGYGDAAASRVSPTRPPSVRKRQSMHIIELEGKLDQLERENRALQDARLEYEQAQTFSRSVGLDLNATIQSRDAQLQEKLAEIERIKTMLQPMQEEITRLQEINEGLTEANRHLVDDTNGRYATLQAEHSETNEQWQSTRRELEALRGEHARITTGMKNIVETEIVNALADKNSEILRLREELDVASEQIRALQVQIQATRSSDFLLVRDEDYFDTACQKLCQHVQQWVLRFSKLSDNRICRLSTEVNDEKIETRIDNAILDGSDADKSLVDRIRRRDVFMSIVMTMIWEYVFTRYLFGMDREQRQKLKALEKILAEVGPPRAVAHWRATTLTLLAKRPEFAKQCAMDTEAVAAEIYTTLCALLPPPSAAEQQLRLSLQRVVGISAELSIEMRVQRAEYIMLPPLQPEYDTNGDLLRKVHFNASLMNERSGLFSSNPQLEQDRAIVKIVLFPLVVKKGNDLGEDGEEIVVCPAQVLVQNDSGRNKKVVRVMSSAMEIDDPSRSRQSLISVAPGSIAF